MIAFVNAKINIGLQVVRRREDGYHDLQTLFYPVGIYAGTPVNPETFCDIIEVTPGAPGNVAFEATGRAVDCPPEKNLVWRAARLMLDRGMPDGFGAAIRLDKHLPDGAGMGGGSADASSTLRLLRDAAAEYAALTGKTWDAPDDAEMAAMALRLGADCPFFLTNRPAYAQGVGERLEPVPLELGGKWLTVVKPAISISTREAFAGIRPKPAAFDLRSLPALPIEDWRGVVHNDFEDSIFPAHPEFLEIKERLYGAGAEYASLTGSGSCIYGIFADEESAKGARGEISSHPTISASYLLKL